MIAPQLLAAIREQAAALRALDNLHRSQGAYSGDNHQWMLGRALARLDSACRVVVAIAGEDKAPPLEVSNG